MKNLYLGLVIIFLVGCSNENLEEPTANLVNTTKVPILFNYKGNENIPATDDANTVQLFCTGQKLDSIITTNFKHYIRYQGNKITRIEHRFMSYSPYYSEFKYDNKNRLISCFKERGENSGRLTEFIYTGESKIVQKFYGVTDGVKSFQNELTHFYDKKGRLIKSIEPRVIGETDNETMYYYDDQFAPFINIEGFSAFKSIFNVPHFNPLQVGAINNIVQLEFSIVDVNSGNKSEPYFEDYRHSYDDENFLNSSIDDYSGFISHFIFNE